MSCSGRFDGLNDRKGKVFGLTPRGVSIAIGCRYVVAPLKTPAETYALAA